MRDRDSTVKMARELEQRGQPDRAIDLYMQAGAVDQAARLMGTQGRFGQAAALLLKHLRLPDDFSGTVDAPRRKLAFLAASYLARDGQVQPAVRLYIACNETARAADLLERSGDRVAAMQLRSGGELREMPAAASRQSAEARTALATARQHEQQGRLELALELYLQQRLFLDAGRVLALLGRHTDAARTLARGGGHYYAGLQYLKAGDSKAALDTLLSVAPGSEHYRAAAQAVARTAASRDELSFKLESFLSDFISSGPQSTDEVESFLILSRLYEHNDFLEDATAMLRQVLAMVPEHSGALTGLRRLGRKSALSEAQYARMNQEEQAYLGRGESPGAQGGSRAPTADPFALPELLGPPPAGTAPATNTLLGLPADAPAPGPGAPQGTAPAAPAAPEPPAASAGVAATVTGRPLPRPQPPTSASPTEPRPYPATVQQGPAPAAPAPRPPGTVSDTPAADELPALEPLTPETPQALEPLTPEAPQALKPLTPEAPQALAPPQPLQVFAEGATIAGRYRLDGKLGQGGMAMVFKAHDLELEEEIALKVFLQQTIDPEMQAESLARFRQELKLSRRLVHPNILRLYDIGMYCGFRYISMEFVDGATLDALLPKGSPMDFAQGLSYLIQGCAGLQAAHDQGVVHRDIKPDNLMVTRDERVKVLDFGIAKNPTAAGRTAAGMLAGTPEYIAPEQINSFSTVTAASDLYSVGVMAYRMFTGQVPFSHAELMPLLNMHLSVAPRPPRELNPTIPAPLEQLILSLMAKSPDARPPSARALASELRKLQRHFRR